MAGHIRSRFIYTRKQRRNSGARGGQCIIKSEHYVIIMQSYNTSRYVEEGTGKEIGGRRNENATMDVRSYEGGQDQK